VELEHVVEAADPIRTPRIPVTDHVSSLVHEELKLLAGLQVKSHSPKILPYFVAINFLSPRIFREFSKYFHFLSLVDLQTNLGIPQAFLI